MSPVRDWSEAQTDWLLSSLIRDALPEDTTRFRMDGKLQTLIKKTFPNPKNFETPLARTPGSKKGSVDDTLYVAEMTLRTILGPLLWLCEDRRIAITKLVQLPNEQKILEDNQPDLAVLGATQLVMEAIARFEERRVVKDVNFLAGPGYIPPRLPNERAKIVAIDEAKTLAKRNDLRRKSHQQQNSQKRNFGNYNNGNRFNRGRNNFPNKRFRYNNGSYRNNKPRADSYRPRDEAK